MDLEPFLREHPLCRDLARSPLGLFESYKVRLEGGHVVRVTRVPSKSFVSTAIIAGDMFGGDPAKENVFIIATRWTERGLVRKRVDEGLREAHHRLENRFVADIRSADR